jgi:phosphatidylglycerophosphate synthase
MSSYMTSVRDVQANYRNSEKYALISDSGSPLQIYFLKPVSVYATPLFVWLGLSPNQVTWIGFFVGVAACSLLAVGLQPYVTLGAWLYVVHRLFDHIDGNVARYTKRTSYYGHFLDSSLGAVVQLAFFLSIGIGAYRQCQAGYAWGADALSQDAGYLLLAGAFASSSLLITRFVKLDYKWTLANAARRSPVAEVAEETTEGERGQDRRREGGHGPWRMARRARGFVPLVRVAGLILAAHTNALIVYLGFFTLYIPVAFAVQYLRLLQLARRSLRAREPRMDLLGHRVFEPTPELTRPLTSDARSSD